MEAQTLTIYTPPSDPGDPTSNSPHCNSVTLTRSGTPPSGETWFWQTSPDGVSTASSGATKTVFESGTYYIRARNNTTGCWSDGAGSASVIVNPYPAKPGDPTSNSPQCADAGVTLTRSGSPPAGETWYWQTANGGTSTATSGETFIVSTSGTYYIRALSDEGCWSVGSGSLAVTVNPLPADPGNPTSNSPQCENIGVTLTRSGTVPAGETWFWQTSATGTDIANSAATYHVDATGTYYIRSRNDATGCWSTGAGSLAVTVNPELAVSVSIGASANPVCAGIEVTFTASPLNEGSNPHYQWKVDGSDAGTDSPTFAYVPDDGDLVTCTLTSDVSCPTGNPALSNTITMVVNPLNAVSVLVEASATSICPFDMVTYTANPTNEGSDPAYQWKINGFNVGTNSPTFMYPPSMGEQLTVVMTSNITCPTGNPATGVCPSGSREFVANGPVFQIEDIRQLG